MVLGRDKYPVYKAWQGKMGFIGQLFGRQIGIGDFLKCRQKNMPGTAAGWFAIVVIMCFRAIGGLLVGRQINIFRRAYAQITRMGIAQGRNQ